MGVDFLTLYSIILFIFVILDMQEAVFNMYNNQSNINFNPVWFLLPYFSIMCIYFLHGHVIPNN